MSVRIWGMRVGVGQVRRSLVSFLDFVRKGLVDDEDTFSSVMGLVKSVIAEPDGSVSATDRKMLRDMLEEHMAYDMCSRAMQLLDSVKCLDVADIPDSLLQLPMDDRCRIARLLISLACLHQEDKSIEFAVAAAGRLGIPENEVSEILDEARRALDSRRRLLVSGTGIIVALVVITMFILTATLLKSVAFGLIGAYLVLPLEKFFERRIRSRRGLTYWIVSFFSLLKRPLVMLANHIKKTPMASGDCEQDIIGKAVAVTSVTFLLVFTLIFIQIGEFIFSSGDRISNSWRSSHARAAEISATAPAAQEKKDQSWFDGVMQSFSETKLGRKIIPDDSSDKKPKEESALIAYVRGYTENLRSRCANTPFFKELLDEIERVANDKDTMKTLAREFFKMSGGFVGSALRLFTSMVSSFGNFLLSLFFGIFFLSQMAKFTRDDKTGRSGSEYFVRGMFSSKWLPGLDGPVIDEACRIVTGVCERLRTWAKSYFKLVLLDLVIYTIVYWMLGVPYFLLMGVFSGMAVLIPVVGPITAVSAAFIVSLACGSGTALQLFGIVLFFVVYNFIIEQFVTYPAIVGDGVGLNTLETVIVVLLGGFLAGIPGVILAMPAASVAKYLIPQIYGCIGFRSKSVKNGNLMEKES
ncbi:MAG: AI-2E family transporter [Victivallaceae bacterium]|nr:AI-2E family transporter [Victivallaceae bacterium]